MSSNSNPGAGVGAGDRDQTHEQTREVPTQVLLVLAVGYLAVLAIMVNALAVAAQHHWWFGAAASLAVVVRVIPDVLELTSWIDRPKPWPLPFDPRPWLLIAASVVAERDLIPPSQTRDAWLAWLGDLLRPRTPRSRLVAVLVGLYLATMIAGWAAWLSAS